MMGFEAVLLAFYSAFWLSWRFAGARDQIERSARRSASALHVACCNVACCMLHE